MFLDTVGVARKIGEFRRGESIYSQGEAADSVMYVQKGGVKFSVVNGSGKEAVVAMFGPHDFFGEGCMAGQSVRMGTATAITPTTLLVIDKNELLRVLHTEHELSSEALWNRDVHDGLVRRHPCRIWRDRTAGTARERNEKGYAYPARVRFELSEDNPASYRQAADFLLASRLYGIGPTDPATLVSATAILLVVSFIATAIPAIRASGMDPVSALRSD
jgi:hypothetical protein